MEITILDNKYDPETTAMLQAFYSRNHKPIKVRLQELGDDSEAVKKNLEKWYVGYGHKSIGQCGAFTIFIENVSILAAKVFQDSKLYNGQETSTRYIDFSTQELYVPNNNPSIAESNKRFIDFYTKAQEPTIKHVAKKYGLNLDDPIEYKTAKARAFDILRGFLPAGCKTQLSWFTTFTHACDRLVQLSYHPLQEVRNITKEIIVQCKERFPYAFSGIDKDIERYKDYYSINSTELNYYMADNSLMNYFKSEVLPNDNFLYEDTFTIDMGDDITLPEFETRTKGLPVARWTSFNGRFQFYYMLDYGSFRDIQRHRNCDQMLPILTTDWGFHDWYIKSLPEELQEEAEALVIHLQYYVKDELSPVDMQYQVPLGFKVPCILGCDLPQLVYLSELRTSKTVHPTLRHVVKKMADVCKQHTKIYDDQSEDEIDIRRGTQDIVEK